MQLINPRVEWFETLVERSSDTDTRLILRLNPWGIYGLDKHTVFLFGNLGVGAGWQQSILLRSTDGGQHWHEVMTPEPASDVIEVTFVGGGYGWALVLRTAASPGPGFLYRTTDYGYSWQRLLQVPVANGGGYPVRIQLFDRQRGQIRVFDPISNSCCIVTSTDRGETWYESGERFSMDECVFNRATEVIALDGSQWRLEINEGIQRVVISRRLSQQGAWDVVSEIPIEYSNEQRAVP